MRRIQRWVHGALGAASFVPGLIGSATAADTAVYLGEGDKVGDGFTVKEASGELGVPGQVKTHTKDKSLSEGDDAGHLLGDRFGAPGKSENYSSQNWKQNRFGTFKQLENQWDKSLKSGNKVEAPSETIRNLVKDVPWKRVTAGHLCSEVSVAVTLDLGNVPV